MSAYIAAQYEQILVHARTHARTRTHELTHTRVTDAPSATPERETSACVYGFTCWLRESIAER